MVASAGGELSWGRSFTIAASGLGLLVLGACSAFPDGGFQGCVDVKDIDFSANNPRCYNGALDLEDLGAIPGGQGVGEDCSSLSCRIGLECVDDVCEPSGSLEEGSRCLIGAECKKGLNCFLGACIAGGDAKVGEACTDDRDCAGGLRCGILGLSAECIESGDADLGQKCEVQGDCFQGLYCSDGKCSLPVPPALVPVWEGASCGEPSDADVTALFTIPGAPNADAEADFFQLPYPNDIRLDASGHPDLTTFPTPGKDLLGIDLVARYARAVENSTKGWSTHPSILFRFSGALDFDSLKTPDGEARRVVLVDTDDPASTVDRLGLTYTASGNATNYVCDDWLAIGTGRGGTLVPGHTYALWLTTSVRGDEDSSIARAPHFEAMLGDSAPSNAKLAAAHAHYAPLRSYLTTHAIAPETILVATVFTTYDPNAPMRALSDHVAKAPAATTSQWVLCSDGVESPCPQAELSEKRACRKGTADYDEYQALIELPIFQKGEAPYKTEGGAIQSTVQRTEEVCLALSLPKGVMPAGGWPLVVYAHGTGGSMRSHLIDTEAVAGRLARSTPQFAVVGIDQVEHGPRRGGSKEDPADLFFNFTNPDAARGNPLQGAADQLGLLRWAQTVSVSAGDSGGAAFSFDPARIFYYGHSQGSTHGSLALPFSDYPGAVFSGNGGGLALALLNKTNPVNIAGAIPFALQDPDSSGKLNMGELNPALGLLQHYMDAADPLSFAPLLAVRPAAGGTPKHVFQTFGLGDTYSPPETLSSYIYAAAEMSLAEAPSNVAPEGEDVLNMTPVPTVSGNFGTGPFYTLATRQYQPPSGKDGHHVSSNVEACIDDISSFIEDLGNATTPTVPAL